MEINFDKCSTILEEMLSELPPLKKPQRNTLAKMFGKEGNENFASDWLAYLLDPSKFGPEILEQLLALCSDDIVRFDLSTAIVEREHTFEDGRRIDILIKGEGFVVGIENKIYSVEGWKQTDDYSDSLDKYALENDGAKSFKIFLTPKGVDAQCSEFFPLSYGKLVEILKDVEVDFIEDIRKALALKDFIVYIEEVIIMEKTDFKSLCFFGQRYSDMHTLNGKVSNSRREFYQILIQESKKLCALLGEEWAYFPNTSKPTNLCCIHFYKSSNLAWYDINKFYIHFKLSWDSSDLIPPEISIVLHAKSFKGICKGKEKDFIEAMDFKEGDPYLLDYSGGEKVLMDSISSVFEALKVSIEEYSKKIDSYIYTHLLNKSDEKVEQE